MQIAPKQYKKDFSYSYAAGVFATLELLESPHVKDVIRVFINSQGSNNKGLDKIKALCNQHQIPVEVANGLVIKLSNSENCYALAVFNKYKNSLDPDQNHLMLVAPSDMGNLGTIIRTMVGFKVKNLAIIRPGVDIFDPKVVRSSTGAFFRINFEYFSDFEEYQKRFSRQFYPFMLDGKTELSKVNFKTPSTLIFGNEGSGLPERFLRVGESVRIDHSKEIDSLNLSVSVGLALYQWVTKR